MKGVFTASYLFRRKEHRSRGLNFLSYDYVYSIFLGSYRSFQKEFGHHITKEGTNYIHLFPGGGYSHTKLISSIPKSAHIISTQEFTTQYILRNTHHSHITIYTGPYMLKNEIIPLKEKEFFTQKHLKVCFTSIGDFKEKGAFIFANIVNAFHATYPTSLVEFYSIGRNWTSTNIISKGVLPQSAVDSLYEKEMHILISPHTSHSEVVGFPHGVEALIRGVLLFTTDPHDMNHRNGFNFQDELYNIRDVDITTVVNKLHFYDTHRDVLHKNSIISQKKSMELFCYENTMGKIIEFIQNSN
jgi:hypothetical protein